MVIRSLVGAHALLSSVASAFVIPPGALHSFDERDTARAHYLRIPALEAAGLSAYIERPQAFLNATEAEGHTVTLSAVPGDGPPSSRVASLLFAENGLPIHFNPSAIREALEEQKKKHGYQKEKANASSARLHNIGNLVYTTDITIGGQDFQLVLDTGSADSWVVSDPFQCKDIHQRNVEYERCRLKKKFRKDLSPTYKGSTMTLKTAYADGERLQGEIGSDVVTLAGVSVNTTIGLVHEANWNGDGHSSGLMGMAYPSMTRAHVGNAISHYQPIFFDMFKQHKVAPVFSIALSRHNEGGQKGAMALGGLPSKSVVNYKDDFAVTPMSKLSVTHGSAYGGKGSKDDYTFHIADVSSFTVNGQSVNVSASMVVDSGTTMSFVPYAVMNAIAAAWDPPLQGPNKDGTYFTPCDSRPPKLALVINGKELFIDGEDLIIYQTQKPEPGVVCSVGVGGGRGFVGQGLNMMGGTFMKSLLVVFDVGAAQMRFAERIRPESQVAKIHEQGQHQHEFGGLKDIVQEMAKKEKEADAQVAQVQVVEAQTAKAPAASAFTSTSVVVETPATSTAAAETVATTAAAVEEPVQAQVIEEVDQDMNTEDSDVFHAEKTDIDWSPPTAADDQDVEEEEEEEEIIDEWQ